MKKEATNATPAIQQELSTTADNEMRPLILRQSNKSH